MPDPIKSTIITPGLDVSGKVCQDGIPASIALTKYLAEHGVVVEKTGPSASSSCSPSASPRAVGTPCLTALQQFGDDYDRTNLVAVPDFCKKQYPK